MAAEFSVALSKIVDDLHLNKVYLAENYEDIKISTVEINSPGLELTGYFEFFDNKSSINEMVRALPEVKSGEVSVFIGDENPVAELKNNSVVLSTYKVGDNMTGIIGVVGPMRMDYSRVVTGVDFFAKQLEAMLGERLGGNELPDKKDI